MIDLKNMHLVLGVRAEQSLRDAVRAVADAAPDADEPAPGVAAAAQGDDDLELAPAGRKDWIAGVRIGEATTYGELEALGKSVLRRLLRLESRQRIRAENVRLWVVPPPVPVFRDPLPAEGAGGDGEAPEEDDGGEDDGEGGPAGRAGDDLP